MESIQMNRRRKTKSNQKREISHKKVIRCKLFMRPVLEHEICSKFIRGTDKETNNYCKNCEHSF